MAYTRPNPDPDPTTARGVIASFLEGITLAYINKIGVVVFTQIALVNQQLNPETSFVDLSLFFTAWGIVYFLFAYVVPVVAAYAWADKAGVAVYVVGWFGTTLILNQTATVGMVLLVVAIFLVVAVDLIKNSGKNRRGGRPPVR